MRIRNPKRILLLAALILLISGCGTVETTTTNGTRAPTATPTSVPTPEPTNTPTPVPTPVPTPALPGRSEVEQDVLNGRMVDLAQNDDAWTAEDEAGGWYRKSGTILIRAEASGSYAMITESVGLGDPLSDLTDLLGPPIRRDDAFSAYVFADLVVAVTGEERIDAIAFRGLSDEAETTQALQGLRNVLHEYRHLILEADTTVLPAKSGNARLAAYSGSRPFLAVYPGTDRMRWIPVYTDSREYYWVNDHTFLSIDDDTLRPACFAFAWTSAHPEGRMTVYPFVDIQMMDPEIRIDMKYASEDNFLQTDLYGDFTRVYIHPEAAERLVRAHQALQAEYPDLRFLIYDSYRPISAQQTMWDMVQGTEFEAILSDPASWFSNHYIGMAIDMSLINVATGEELDMGTPFDDATRLSWPRYELEFVDTGALTREAYQNRLLMRRFMEAEGFTQLYFEWWQFELHKSGGIPLLFPAPVD